VPPISITFGVLLSVLGVVLVALTGAPTALIPAGFGVVLIALGVAARKPKARMHAMHGAALVALIGFLMPAWRAISALARGEEIGRPSVIGMLIMAALCAVFLVLCINSFIAARRARREEQGAPPA
jgi:hypothetical protein